MWRNFIDVGLVCVILVLFNQREAPALRGFVESGPCTPMHVRTQVGLSFCTWEFDSVAATNHAVMLGDIMGEQYKCFVDGRCSSSATEAQFTFKGMGVTFEAYLHGVRDANGMAMLIANCADRFNDVQVVNCFYDE